MDTLERRIEHARKQMHALLNKYGLFLHPAVIKQSMVLDELINQYSKDQLEKRDWKGVSMMKTCGYCGSAVETLENKMYCTFCDMELKTISPRTV
ncbi:hypothetical protein PAECIP112173_04585 [Paenibacillus sp. JJ-100]|uniref:aspartyl-phosphate phosphatase Spo0E family protein n=1 Tax=Paenibacillus sp. JJ-100 TaxID=2974896 RepID=UPI0022FF7E86|nr:aspartyl-phosphate phosphatase Spo0E family protein [Paenibacillus sp. JJ-100]CAI6085272.1 hypothetical protein PAECIP112173_04585 [Paenibacillus sp. JJ-100]